MLALASIGFMVWAIALKFPLGNGAHFDGGPSRTAKAAQSVGTLVNQARRAIRGTRRIEKTAQTPRRTRLRRCGSL